MAQLFPGRMNAAQCHQQFLECCRRAGKDDLDPEVKRQWMELAEAWRFAAQQAEAFERAENLGRRVKNET
jgi:hypothetical protein